MHQSITPGCSIPDFCLQYGDYLFRVRGLAASTRKLHRHVVHRFLTFRFPDGKIIVSDLRFSDLVDFLKEEFARLSSRETQRAWLMILRSVLRYLSEAGQIPKGWEGALPKVANHSYARLPKNLSQDQANALRAACRGEKQRHFRNRALLLLFLRLGLRVQEVAGLTPSDIDWENGYLKVRCTKTYNDRILPLPQDVGRALVAHLRKCRSHPERIFEPLRPPFTAERSYTHVLNSIRYVFGLAGINDRGAHSLRHTAATEMVNAGASFKDVADVLGHKSITTTFIYAKLDMKSLMRVALPWPGGAR
jgi:site-specific recombinase XerD